jgi:hypothetical protein
LLTATCNNAGNAKVRPIRPLTTLEDSYVTFVCAATGAFLSDRGGFSFALGQALDCIACTLPIASVSAVALSFARRAHSMSQERCEQILSSFCCAVEQQEDLPHLDDVDSFLDRCLSHWSACVPMPLVAVKAALVLRVFAMRRPTDASHQTLHRVNAFLHDAIPRLWSVLCSRHDGDEELVDVVRRNLPILVAALLTEASEERQRKIIDQWTHDNSTRTLPWSCSKDSVMIDTLVGVRCMSTSLERAIDSRRYCVLMHRVLLMSEGNVARFIAQLLLRNGHTTPKSPRHGCPSLPSMIAYTLSTASERSRDASLCSPVRRLALLLSSESLSSASLPPWVVEGIVGAFAEIDHCRGSNGWSPCIEVNVKNFLRTLSAATPACIVEILRCFVDVPPPPWVLRAGLTCIASSRTHDVWEADVAVSLRTRDAHNKEVLLRRVYQCILQPSNSYLEATTLSRGHHQTTSIDGSQWAAAAALLQAAMTHPHRDGGRHDRSSLIPLIKGSANAILEAIAGQPGHDAAKLTEYLTTRLAREFGVFAYAHSGNVCASPQSMPATLVVPPRTGGRSFPESPQEQLTQLVLQSRGPLWGADVWQRGVQLLRASVAGNAGNDVRVTASLHAEVLRRVGCASWFGAAHVVSLLWTRQTRRNGRQRPATVPLRFSASTAFLLFDRFGRVGAWITAMKFASLLDQHPRVSPHAWPSDAGFLSCLTACRVSRRWDAALRVFDELFRTASTTPTSRSAKAAALDKVEAHQRSNSGRQVSLQFSHVGEFVGALVAPGSPAEAVQLCLSRFEGETRCPSTRASPHLHALLHLLRQQPTIPSSADANRLAPLTRQTNRPTVASLEVFLSLLDASTSACQGHPNTNFHSGGVSSSSLWQTAVAAFADAIRTPPCSTPYEEAEEEGSDPRAPLAVSTRCLLSLASILRRSQRWEEALSVYHVGRRIIGSQTRETGMPQRPWEDNMTYQTLATVAHQPSAWRTAVLLLQENAVRSHNGGVGRNASARAQRRGVAVQNHQHRLVDRVLHAVLSHTSPMQWSVALRITEACATTMPLHAAELMMSSSDVPMVLRLEWFHLLQNNRALPVAFTHGAAPAVVALAHDINQSTSHKKTDGLRVLLGGIRNVDVRAQQLLDPHANSSKILPSARTAFLRTYWEALVRRWATEAKDADVDPHTADTLVGRLFDLWQTCPRDGKMAVSRAVLQDVAAVLENVVGDHDRAESINAWLGPMME